MQMITLTNASKAHRSIGTEKFRPSIALAPGASVDVEASMWDRIKGQCPAIQGLVLDGTIAESAPKDATKAHQAKLAAEQAESERAAKAAADTAAKAAKSAEQKAADKAAKAADEAERVKSSAPAKADK